jgi:hypothetical protein
MIAKVTKRTGLRRAWCVRAGPRLVLASGKGHALLALNGPSRPACAHRALRLTVYVASMSPDRADAKIDDPLDVRLEPHRAHERKRRRPFRGKDRGEPTRGGGA